MVSRVEITTNAIQGLGAQCTAGLTITAAQKMLVEPNDEKPEAPNVIDQEELVQDEEPKDQEPVMVVLPGGKEVTPEEAKEFYESDFERLAKEQEKAEAAKARAKKAQEKAKKQAEKLKKDMEKQQQTIQAEFRDAVRASFEQELQEIHARYGIEEAPAIFGVDEERWKEALANTKNRREGEILKIL